jgi:hypothetical protein
MFAPQKLPGYHGSGACPQPAFAFGQMSNFAEIDDSMGLHFNWHLPAQSFLIEE